LILTPTLRKMDNLARNEPKFSVLIGEESRKLVIINPFKTVRVEFTDPHNNYVGDLALPGVTTMCMCCPRWRRRVLTSNTIVSLANYARNRYELVPVEFAFVPNVIRTCYIEKLGECHRQVCAEIMQISMGQGYEVDGYKIKPTFYNWTEGFALEPCKTQVGFCANIFNY
jgi:hypothetical protein